MSEDRFKFGENWQQFVSGSFNEERLETSRQWMLDFLGYSTLDGKSFLDIGCGSGMHSLAAVRSGCRDLFSFDYDTDSVGCTEQLRKQAGEPAYWSVQRGSVLDEAFMTSLPQFDIVYSWGVLHHTGDQWRAIEQAQARVKPGGLLYIALYTSEMFPRWKAPFWLRIKKFYNSAPELVRTLLVWAYAFFHSVQMLMRGTNPFRYIRGYSRSRGMNYFVDIRDWLGGWPMEFSSVNDVVQFLCRQHSFVLTNLKFGEACTEYLFRREK
jgi:SAM-dependent methyltransferase